MAGIGDERLTDLVETALSDNLSLRAARARIQQAGALERQAAARLFPAFGCGFGSGAGVARRGGQIHRQAARSFATGPSSMDYSPGPAKEQTQSAFR